jgi:hypothetical protein
MSGIREDLALLDAVQWAQALAITVHCNYVGGEEAFTASYHDVFNGDPDVFAHGPSWLDAITRLRAALHTEDA